MGEGEESKDKNKDEDKFCDPCPVVYNPLISLLETVAFQY